MSKWTNLDAGKIQVSRFNTAFNKLGAEHSAVTELCGTKGVDEYRCSVFQLFSGNRREDVAAAQERIGQAHNYTLTKKNAVEVTAALLKAFEEVKLTRPINDKRTTPEENQERNEAFAESQRAQEEASRNKAAAFTSLYGNGGTVKVEDNQVAVVARLCYDNSDLMSDYFDRHASLSQEFALLVTHRQNETEALARRAVALYPELANISFDWHTEKYSMGHGNYLESAGFELPESVKNLRSQYRGGGVTHGHWEIQFHRSHGRDLALDTFKGYAERPAPQPSTAANPVSGVVVTENIERGGIELRFPEKPAHGVIESLKANGWRWSRFSSCWWIKASDTARTFANNIAGGSQ